MPTKGYYSDSCHQSSGLLCYSSSQYLLFPEKEAKSVVPLRGKSKPIIYLGNINDERGYPICHSYQIKLKRTHIEEPFNQHRYEAVRS
jgi:hypothetical protein